MILGDGMLHADHVAFHPDAGVVFASIEHQHGLFRELARTVVGIVGQRHLSLLARTDRLFRELGCSASAPGIHVVDDDHLAALVGERESVAHLAVFLVDGAEVVDALVILECLEENRFLSSAQGKAQEQERYCQ